MHDLLNHVILMTFPLSPPIRDLKEYANIFIKRLLWPPFVADADIIFSSCGFFFLSSFFVFSSPNISRCRWVSTWCGLGANLEHRSEMCCTWLAENTGCKKLSKIRNQRTITTLSGCIFATKACIDNQKKTC